MLKIYGDERSSRPKNEKTGSWKASGSVDSGRRELQLLDVLVAADEQLVGDEPARAGRVFRVNGRNVHHGVVGGQFVLKSPLEMIVYPDSTAPYYLGEMMTKWTMPIIESEVQQIWQ